MDKGWIRGDKEGQGHTKGGKTGFDLETAAVYLCPDAAGPWSVDLPLFGTQQLRRFRQKPPEEACVVRDCCSCCCSWETWVIREPGTGGSLSSK